ncbi:hypothetical protein [Streptomyces sp. NPDC057496]|uniref:hypothetical protein n=1 Tax=Streptomyces sp. NPDC057496 TaxID=3346149 RepID=UPI0036A9AEFA
MTVAGVCPETAGDGCVAGRLVLGPGGLAGLRGDRIVGQGAGPQRGGQARDDTLVGEVPVQQQDLDSVIAVVVLAVNVHDNTVGIALLSEVAENAGGAVSNALVDQGSRTRVVTHEVGPGIDVEIVRRNPQHKRFVPQPKRWRGEQTYGILILHRSLVRDYEHRPASSASRAHVEGTRAKLKRLVELGLLTEADTGNFTGKS